MTLFKKPNKENILDIIVLALYSEIYPQEDYCTADYINGRIDRARKHYIHSSIFSAKVNKIVALILNEL